MSSFPIDDPKRLQASKTFYSAEIQGRTEAFAPLGAMQLQPAEPHLATSAASARSSIDVETDDFCAAISQCQRVSKDKVITDFDIRAKHSWDEVMVEARRAHDEYEKAQKGLRGVHRKVFRFLGDKSEAINPWLDLIPNGMYTSIICGGLKLVFKAISSMSEKREKILIAFADLPATVEEAQHCREKFNDDTRLRALCSELYSIVLQAIEKMIHWLVGGERWQHAKALLGGSRSGKNIDLQIDQVQKQLQAVNVRFRQLWTGAVVDTKATVDAMQPKVDGIYGWTSQLAQRLPSMESAITGILKSLEAQHQQSEWKIMRLERQLDGYRQNKSLDRGIDQRAANTIPRSLVSEIIDADPMQSTQDLDTIVAHAHTIPQSAQNKAFSVLESPQFQKWFGAAKSSLLLVDGNEPESGLDFVSPMSVLSTIFIRSLASMHPAKYINHMCSVHTSPRDPLNGPQGLLRSLISQVLEFQDFDFSSLHGRRTRQRLRDHEPTALCRLLWDLIHQLPFDTVLFCIIDGISVCEKSSWLADVADTLGMLQDLTQDRDLGSIFKVLITTATVHRNTIDQVPRKNYFVVPIEANTFDGAGDLLAVGGPLLLTKTSSRSFRSSRRRSRARSEHSVSDDNTPVEDFDEGNV